VLDTGGRTLTVSNTLDVTGGTVSNTTGTIVYHRLNGSLPGNSQQFNSLPVISAAAIGPSAPIDTDNLLVSVTSSNDADNDPITLAYQWQDSGDNSEFSNIAFTSDSLTNTATTPGRYYHVVITPNDGIADGLPFTTTSVTIPSDLQILSILISGADVLINYSAVSNQTYELLFKADLTITNWDGIATNTPTVTGLDQFIDAGAASKTQRFYRVRQLP
jgi:hypothetical protein